MGLCEDVPSCDKTYNAVMPLSRASTRERYNRIVGVTPSPSSMPTMELLTHDGEHHEIGDGGWLMMTTATNPPPRSPERTPDQPTRERLGLGGGSVS